MTRYQDDRSHVRVESHVPGAKFHVSLTYPDAAKLATALSTGGGATADFGFAPVRPDDTVAALLQWLNTLSSVDSRRFATTVLELGRSHAVDIPEGILKLLEEWIAKLNPLVLTSGDPRCVIVCIQTPDQPCPPMG